MKLQKISLLCLLSLFTLLSIKVHGQSTNQNYIKTTTYINDGNNSIETIRYFDGLGRPIQTLQKGVTTTGKDLATYTEYDPVGREWKTYLPITNSGNGTFVELSNFKSGSVHNDARAFVENIYEPSPLNRIEEVKGAGNAWRENPVIIKQDANANDVKYFYVNSANQLAKATNYTAGSLYKSTITDEDGKTTTEYKDKLERVVMTRQSTNHDTYYVYNDLGQLAFVLPPLAADVNGNAEAMKKYGYEYRYDNRGNCIYKKLPGVEPVYMIHDKADRVIATQDGNQRTKNQWTVIKYDKLGRELSTSLITKNSSLENMVNTYKNTVVVEAYSGAGASEYGGYSCQHFPGSHQMLTVNYYDKYDFITDNNLQSVEQQGYSTAYKVNGQHMAKGLLTGSRTYLLDDSGNFTEEAIYYDYRGRIVQTRATNHLGGYDIAYHDVNFSGNPNQTLKEHNIAGNPVILEYYTYAYDHAGRPTTTGYRIDDKELVTLTHNFYDELGRVIEKKRHNNADTEEYDYNIRNQTTRIKSGDFEQKLYYNTRELYSEPITLCYNGNISAMTWTHNNIKRAYVYQYDNLNRLELGTAYQTSGNTLYAPHNKEEFNYDKHGNIIRLWRQNDYTLIDFLSISHDGNQIKSIYDNCHSQNQQNIKEYQDLADSDEFSYDDNGNLTKDLDREIELIEYNVLNLPEKVSFANGNEIVNTYDAAGRKLLVRIVTKTAAVHNPLVISDLLPGRKSRPLPDRPFIPDAMEKLDKINTYAYIANMEYDMDKVIVEAGVLDEPGSSYLHAPAASSGVEGVKKLIRIHNPEGYVANNKYHYYRRDHLGNNREVWNATTNTVAQRTQYYPSGLPWQYSSSDKPDAQPYKYNGKEFVEAHGLDEYDSEARWYYPAIMRTTTPDPHAENYYNTSPYAWCGNNPISRVDLDGRDDYYYNEKGKLIYKFENKTPDKNFLIKTTQSTNDMYGAESYAQKGNSLSISNEDATFTESQIAEGNLKGDHMKNIVQIENSFRMKAMIGSIKDDGKGGSALNNNREYSGSFGGKEGVYNIRESKPGKPSAGKPLVTTGIIDFHSHPSGTEKIIINRESYTGSWLQPPSKQDIKDSGVKTHYVIGMGSGIIYIYNSKGVLATIPISTFR